MHLFQRTLITTRSSSTRPQAQISFPVRCGSSSRVHSRVSPFARTVCSKITNRSPSTRKQTRSFGTSAEASGLKGTRRQGKAVTNQVRVVLEALGLKVTDFEEFEGLKAWFELAGRRNLLLFKMICDQQFKLMT